MMRTLTYWQALAEGLVQGMERDPSVFVFGIGVDDHKGVFGTTRAAFERFGAKRVFDVPIAEQAMTGIAIGAAAMGKRPVLVHPRNDFMFLAADQMINLAAKWRYMYGGGVRGADRGAGHRRQGLGAGRDALPEPARHVRALPRDAGGDAGAAPGRQGAHARRPCRRADPS